MVEHQVVLRLISLIFFLVRLSNPSKKFKQDPYIPAKFPIHCLSKLILRELSNTHLVFQQGGFIVGQKAKLWCET